MESVLTCVRFEKVFCCKSEEEDEVFDFTRFYEEKEQSTAEEVLLRVEAVLEGVC